MFRKISPQKVQHATGYVIQVANRNSVEYLDGEFRAVIEVDFGVVVSVFQDSIQVFASNGKIISPDASQKADLLSKVVAGLQAMGSNVDLC